MLSLAPPCHLWHLPVVAGTSLLLLEPPCCLWNLPVVSGTSLLSLEPPCRCWHLRLVAGASHSLLAPRTRCWSLPLVAGASHLLLEPFTRHWSLPLVAGASHWLLDPPTGCWSFPLSLEAHTHHLFLPLLLAPPGHYSGLPAISLASQPSVWPLNTHLLSITIITLSVACLRGEPPLAAPWSCSHSLRAAPFSYSPFLGLKS
ncbi:hypothetical protein PCASD_20908 [Puccinia coronata f. sp. avenae]|uniref:Uncharacterized protein n=1 Tax=Puccinia coronata f. sp. avenae TaxID=200324 RepID=A0A2N5TVW9_9BASI|nr:hypothetical protein PCASD_20908 [Puccinia coronata f. sp. avenae]